MLTAIAGGETVAGNIAVVGQTQQYTFTASANDWFDLKLSDANAASGLRPEITIYGPSGQQVAQSSTGTSGTSTSVYYAVPPTGGGTYTAVVRDDGLGRGAHRRIQSGDVGRLAAHAGRARPECLQRCHRSRRLHADRHFEYRSLGCRLCGGGISQSGQDASHRRHPWDGADAWAGLARGRRRRRLVSDLPGHAGPGRDRRRRNPLRGLDSCRVPRGGDYRDRPFAGRSGGPIDRRRKRTWRPSRSMPRARPRCSASWPANWRRTRTWGRAI